MKKPRVLLADDHPILLEGLKSLLSRDFDIVGTAQDGNQALEMAERLNPDLIVLDIIMPRMNGIEAARRLRALASPARIIILSMHSEQAFVTEAFGAGAYGYVLKDSASEDLLVALKLAIKGRKFISARADRFDRPRP